MLCVKRMSSQKSRALTKGEVMQLLQLVEGNPVIFNKATNADNNQLKEAAWITITNRFNAIIASGPRRPEQLRLKWDNLKKSARKRLMRIKLNTLETGVVKPNYIPPDEALDKVASILSSKFNGNSVQFGGDAVVRVVEQEMETVEKLAVVKVPHEPVNVPTSVVPPALSLHTTKPKFRFSSVSSKGKQKRPSIADELKTSIKNRNRAIVDYYVSKGKREEEIFALKKRKLELEIMEREKNLTYDAKFK